MTQEQYNRAVAINRQLKELEDVKDEIKDTKEHRLSYTYKKSNGSYELCYESRMRYISDILDRHDKMIREEIDADIEKLKKEIEEL